MPHYLYEPLAEAYKQLKASALEGMQFRPAPLLASSNLVDWETVFCRVDSAGYLHAPDGSLLQLHGEWSEELYEWVSLAPVMVRGGTNGVMFFRVP